MGIAKNAHQNHLSIPSNLCLPGVPFTGLVDPQKTAHCANVVKSTPVPLFLQGLSAKSSQAGVNLYIGN